MHVMKMIGSKFGTPDINMIAECKNMVKITPDIPMKKPRANSIPFFDFMKPQEMIMEDTMKPRIVLGDDAKIIN